MNLGEILRLQGPDGRSEAVPTKVRSDQAMKGPLVHKQTHSTKFRHTRFPVNIGRSAWRQKKGVFSGGHWELVLTPPTMACPPS